MITTRSPKIGDRIEYITYFFNSFGIGVYVGKCSDGAKMVRQMNGLSVYIEKWRYPGRKKWNK